ncbi:MAG: methylmalonyl-CoA mutase [Kordia sp.]|nr:MAG: methylmalonyl-CoA mutase [Kordia sp.]
MSNFLFKEFEEVSSSAWKQQIQVDLKGADYNDTLLWTTNEGITVKPFYHKDANITTPEISKNNWSIAQLIKVIAASDGNKNAIEAIDKGAEAIVFEISTELNIHDLLLNIDTKTIELQFKFKLLNLQMAEGLIQLNLPKCYLNIDIIGNLALTGNWYSSLKEDFQFIKTLIAKYPKNHIISVDTAIYQNAGATVTQQLAYAIAHTNEYFNNFKDAVLPKIQFITATGGNYFFEIAKIRALKLLFKTITEAYNTDKTECTILSYPSCRNKTIYDYNVNMLRSTTECMSVILGGANTICNLPYDHIYHNSNEFGNRIARNQLLVLKHESAFTSVNNPSDGAYYIESITHQFAENALEIFKLIESGGGFLAQLKEGTIQRKIKESGLKEQEQFDNGSLVLLGTNKYPNEKDKMKHELEKQPFVIREARKTLIAPITPRRLSEKSDKERLEQE